MQLRLPSVRVRWTAGLILLLLVLAWFNAPNPISGRDATDPFLGRWLVNGTDPFGKEYSGSLTILAGDDGGYRVEWIVTGAIVSGTGELAGDRLAVRWTRREGGRDAAGTAEYVIADDGRLIGSVTTDGVAAVGSETAERLPG